MSNVPPGDDYVVTADLRQMTFAEKLHQILSREDLSDCISWIPHGRAFRIVMPKRLEERSILQVYFGHNRYSTFLGQLKNYGLKQITQGKDKHCFYNEVRADNVWCLVYLILAFARSMSLPLTLSFSVVLASRSASSVQVHEGVQEYP